MSGARASKEEVRGVVLPTGAADLLMPNAAVVEVIAYCDPEPYPSAPGWLLGAVYWRGRDVPLLSLAAAGTGAGAAAPRLPRARLVICYTPSGNSALPYVGILAVAPPRLARLSAEMLEPAQMDPDNPFVLYALTYAEQPAWIPDMDAIERAVLEAIQP